MRTLANAVQTEVAFRLVPGHAADRIVAALTVPQTTVAVVAGGCVFRRLRIDQRDKAPSSAPRDKARGRKNLVTRRFRAMMQIKISPRVRPCRKCGCLKLSTAALRRACSPPPI